MQTSRHKKLLTEAMCFDLNLVDYLSNIFEDSNLSLAIGFIIIHQNKAILQWL